MALAGHSPREELAPILFPEWKEALARSDLPETVRGRHERAIGSFLAYCATCCAPASIVLAKRFLEQLSPAGASAARASLGWFIGAGRTRRTRA